MSLLAETEQILRAYGIVPNKKQGQNFLIDESIFPLLTSYASVTAHDTVLDVGAGFGFLTRFLAGECETVLAIEKESSIVRVLVERLGGTANVAIIEGDVLATDVPSFDKVVSAPPYQISSALLMWLFNRQFSSSVLVLQKEFAKRLVAEVESEDYSWLTVYAYSRGTTELLHDVPRRMFYPEPEVDSIVVRLTPYAQPRFGSRKPSLFVQMLKHVFSERNKKLENAVLPFARNVLRLSVEDAKRRVSMLPLRETRVRALAPESFGELAHVLID